MVQVCSYRPWTRVLHWGQSLCTFSLVFPSFLFSPVRPGRGELLLVRRDLLSFGQSLQYKRCHRRAVAGLSRRETNAQEVGDEVPKKNPSEIPMASSLSALFLPVLGAALTERAKSKGNEKLLLLDGSWGHPTAHDIYFLAWKPLRWENLFCCRLWTPLCTPTCMILLYEENIFYLILSSNMKTCNRESYIQVPH